MPFTQVLHTRTCTHMYSNPAFFPPYHCLLVCDCGFVNRSESNLEKERRKAAGRKQDRVSFFFPPELSGGFFLLSLDLPSFSPYPTASLLRLFFTPITLSTAAWRLGARKKTAKWNDLYYQQPQNTINMNQKQHIGKLGSYFPPFPKYKYIRIRRFSICQWPLRYSYNHGC